MCDIQPLINFDVFATQPRNDDFKFNNTCQTVSSPFEQYCLIPPSSRLEATNTCRPFLEDTHANDFIFPHIINGQIKTLEDLPPLFISFPQTESKETWISEPDIKANDAFTKPLGVSRIAISNTGPQMLCLASIGNNTLQLYQLDAFGFFRAQRSDTGNLLTTPTSDTRCNVFVNGDGSLLFALLSGNLYQYVSATWTLVKTTVLDLWFTPNAIVYVLQTSLFFDYGSSSTASLPFPLGILWTCLTQDRNFIIVATNLSAFQIVIQVIDITTRSVLDTWTMNAVFNTVSFAICLTQTFTNTTTLELFVTQDNNTLDVTLVPSLPTAQVTVIVNQFIARFYNNIAWIINNQLFIVNQLPIALAPGMDANTALAPTQSANEVFAFASDGTLQRLSQQQLPWTNNFDLYMEFGNRLNDTQSTPSQPIALWYMGSVFVTIPTIDAPLPFVLGISRHNRYRWVLQSVVVDFLPHAVSQMQHINDFYLLTTGEDVRFYEDANIVVQDEHGAVIWESNTRDRFGDSGTYQNWIARSHPLSTGNGLYLCFVNAQQNRVVIAYNVFNSPQFANWCRQDTEYITRALNAQREFCFRNLHVDDLFFDPRCACVGGTQLFQELFPGVAFDTQTTGRLVAALPCLSSECGTAFLEGPENTNVYDYVHKQCEQDVVICSDILSASADLNIRNYQVNQYCGSNPNTCLQNEQCPIGSQCINGQCVLSCTSDLRCREALKDPFALCVSGACVFAEEKASQQKKQNWQIVALVILILVLIMFIVLMVVFIPKKRKHH